MQYFCYRSQYYLIIVIQVHENRPKDFNTNLHARGCINKVETFLGHVQMEPESSSPRIT